MSSYNAVRNQISEGLVAVGHQDDKHTGWQIQQSSAAIDDDRELSRVDDSIRKQTIPRFRCDLGPLFRAFVNVRVGNDSVEAVLCCHERLVINFKLFEPSVTPQKERGLSID